MIALGVEPSVWLTVCDGGAAAVVLLKLPTLKPGPCANCTTNQPTSAAATVLPRRSVSAPAGVDGRSATVWVTPASASLDAVAVMVPVAPALDCER